MSKRGAELAARLGRAIPAEGVGTAWLIGKCSTLCRHGAAYNTIQERWCNEEMTEAMTAAVEKREAQLERLMMTIVGELPLPRGAVEGSTWGVEFSGDPRGGVVMIVVPEGAERIGDSFGGENKVFVA